MLLAVEGGGFFSSSASGYSKGLALLLLGQCKDEPMRVSPWNQYQLVEKEPNSDLQLASIKNRPPRGCASFVCFRRASAGFDGPSPLKVGPVQQQEISPNTSVSDEHKDDAANLNGNNNERQASVKSSLKKQHRTVTAPTAKADNSNAVNEERKNATDHPDQRKVQWTDACGSELVEIREFEPR